MSDACLREAKIPRYVHPSFAALLGQERAGVLPNLGWESAWKGMTFLYVAGYGWARRRDR
ncbi:MAG TPA: hypothetical protein VM890_08765 [Longimicrobium sp.]|jgi:hypothetical protein|nr:hypothetical protein [Longimicrobium sp.]